MDRLRRLTSLWSWLPSFRAVAETEHLPAAGGELHVSASALSRTIRLLEDDVGQPLFTRAGRSLKLNAAGQKLLSTVRDAMRLVDEGLASVSEGALVGRVKLACDEPFASMYLVPALVDVVAEHPGLVPSVVPIEPEEDPAAALLQGQVDLIVQAIAEPNDDITIHRLHNFRTAVYCGRQHPLFRQQCTQAELLKHDFVCPDDNNKISSDGWPAELTRQVGARAPAASVYAFCKSGRFLAVLPRTVAERERGELHRLEAVITAPVTLFALQRRSLGFEGRAEAVLAKLPAHLPKSPDSPKPSSSPNP